jgi:HPt (histidine-containing phosphotransfer) domain-containing protein
MTANESRRLDTLQQLNILDTPAEQEYDDLVLLATEIAQCPKAALSFIAAERLWFKAQIGFTTSEMPRLGSFCHEASLSHGLFLVTDVQQDARFNNNLKFGDLKFYAGVPLLLNDHVVGTLCVFDSKAKTLTVAQQNAFLALSRQCMLQLRARAQRIQLKGNEQAALEASRQKPEFLANMSHEIDAAPITLASVSEVIDSEIINALLGLGATPGALLNELIQMFVELTPHSLEQIETAVRDGDWKALVFAAHSYKSSSGNIGATIVAQLCEELENAAQVPAIERINQALPKLRFESRKAIMALEIIARSNGRQAS